MNRNTATEEAEVRICDACNRVPLSHLSLDIAEPLTGWTMFFRERGIEVTADDVGRASVPRRVLGELLAEHREREARLAAQRAEQATARKAPVPAGVPAVEGASPFESMAAGPGYVTPQQELGRPKPRFLDEALAEGQRQAAVKRAEAEAEAVKRAREALEGRDK
jgi:hypothetical protein